MHVKWHLQELERREKHSHVVFMVINGLNFAKNVRFCSSKVKTK